MSNCAMSNETDLDWLARNHHTWPSKADVVVSIGWKCMKAGEPDYVRVNLGKEITKEQWLARRAELQNKPSWGDFGESAKFMAQDSDGAWMAFESEPVARYHVWSSMRGRCGYAREGRDRCRGEVLGDWRDTLEKRPYISATNCTVTSSGSFGVTVGAPADLSEQAVTARLQEATDNVLAAAPELMSDKYKFEPFVSVEDAAAAKHATITPSKYTKTIHGVSVDVYDVLQAWGVSNPALQHLIKKALQCGRRGHKDNAQDLQDIIDSAIRAKELG